MLVRIVAALVVLFLSCGCAAAASFDCGRAATPFERAVCNSPDLSEKDEILATAYATALGGLSDEAATAVTSGQREWLDFAQRACTDDAEPMTQGEYGDDAVACLVSVYQRRIDVLSESRMRGGWRVYPVGRYAAIRDPDATAESYAKVAQKQFVLPRIDHAGEIAAAFNALMESLASSIESAPAMDEGGATRLDDPSSDHQVTATIESVTPQRISVAFNAFWFGHGAAHGNYTITYLHYVLAEGRPLEATDVFAGETWQEPLAAAALAELKRSIEGGPWQTTADELVPLVSDPERWAFGDTGLVLQFQPYEVTAYAFGAPTVTIPWQALDAYLAPGSDSVIYGY